jgi:2-polyprenyl-3-methyl-5-hydroxy-6-metoxy-1,4-benzoquinol methylase
MGLSEYRCPACMGALTRDSETLSCERCRADYAISDQIADFSGGTYCDNFNETATLTADHIRGLELENEGATRRISAYYLPLIATSAGRGPRRILDAGCGNGISVDVLRSEGYEAWGVDLSQLRRWQWHQRIHRNHLAVADVGRLPFATDYFNFVLCSGVVEHVGVQSNCQIVMP